MTRTSKSGESGLDTTTQSGVTSQSSTKVYKCSFCHKKQDEVNRLIAGANQVYICDECVMLCQEIISDSSDQKVAPLEEAARLNANKSKLSADFLKRSTAAMHAIDEMQRLARPHASSLPPELPKQLLSAIAFAAQQIKDHFETEAASTQEEVWPPTTVESHVFSLHPIDSERNLATKVVFERIGVLLFENKYKK